MLSTSMDGRKHTCTTYHVLFRCEDGKHGIMGLQHVHLEQVVGGETPGTRAAHVTVNRVVVALVPAHTSMKDSIRDEFYG